MDHIGLINGLFIPLFLILGGANIILLLNLKWFKRLDQFPVASHWPSVSVLVPARNEEQNIETCIHSLLNQDYPNFEVIALDDESSDDTLRILLNIQDKDQRLKVVNGKPLPGGWAGKNWACHQLSETASGELILFTDADTLHHTSTLKEAVSALLAQNADLLSAIPFEELGSWGEKILLPYIFISCLFSLPLGIAYKLKSPLLCYCLGQFMLFKRNAYLHVGGHERIKGIVIEDLALGRQIKAAGLQWRLMDAGTRVHCRMYRNFTETWKGLTKFLYLGYENQILQPIVIWAGTSLAFLGPLFFFFRYLSESTNRYPSLYPILIALILDFSLWIISNWRLRFPVWLSLLFPLTFILNFIATLFSIVLTLTGHTTWKDRPLIKPES